MPPDYIAVNWTDEMLAVMVEKLVARKRQEAGEPSDQLEESEGAKFQRMGIKYYEVKHGD